MKELIEIQAKLNAPKSQYNAFGKYKYRSCEDILAAVKPLLTATGCTLTISDTITEVGGRIYVMAEATLTNSAGESVSTTAYAREESEKKGMDASQVTGAASSYARKYALNGLFAIDDTKDADAPATDKDEPTPAELFNAYAMPAIQQATSTKELQRIWNDFPSLQESPAFKAAMSSRKKQVLGQ